MTSGAASTRDATDVAIIGAGPCGLAAAITLRASELDTLVFDAGVVVSTIFEYPTYATFFSTAEKLSIGGMPFVTATEKPTRRDALAYYRAAVRHFAIPVRQYEPVIAIDGRDGAFHVRSRTAAGVERRTSARAVVVATGYFGSPNWIGVPGERLPHVTHIYREGHPAFDQDVVVVGGGNSAAEAALDLWRSGARVTLVHFGPTFDKRIKPWVLPDITNRMTEGSIAARWSSQITGISADAVSLHTAEGDLELPAQKVYLMTGFAPNVELLRSAGVTIDPVTGIPAHRPETLETDVPGIFIAGVVVAGFDANKVFIENGRFHGQRIAARLLGRAAPAEPKLSAELDS
ncbi:MAG: YpdA family putative bacillithiol disulfide reductase [Gemmatimonadota bacterium]|nr:YpdA family putative bacillithiol disulfide reductase [Gemmatimonadota bacterium]